MTTQTPIPREVLAKFILGFPERRLPDELRSYLAAGLAGVILFPRNFSSPQQLRSLSDEIRHAAGRPVFIGIDQEGGYRFSLPEPFTQWPSAEELGLLNDLSMVERVAAGLARELRAAGCNLDFAPMLDLHLHPESAVTKQRSFSSDPHQVGESGAAFARGLLKEGVLPCAKHFPGHGDTKLDPHETLPSFDGTIDRLRTMELVPFARLIHDHVPMIMTAHILLSQIDPETPATLSRRILTELLRESMQFEGIILADDLGMGAIRERLGPEKSAIETFRAGSDLALLCHEWSEVHPVLKATALALHAGMFNEREWHASQQRIHKLLSMAETASHQLPIEIVGSSEHRSLANQVRKASKTPPMR